MADAPAAQGSSAGPARMAPEPQAEPAQGADILHQQGEDLAPQGARCESVRDWSTIPDPLGGESLPMMMEVCGRLRWASSGTTRGMRNRLFEAVLLRRDRREPGSTPGGWLAWGDQERVNQALIRAGWPNRAPEWPAFPKGEAGAARHGR